MDMIDRQEAIDTILSLTNCSTVRELYEYIQEHQLTNFWTGGINDAIDAVIGVPSAQPERKKGKWMVVDADIAESSDICECDQCGGRIWKYKNAKDTWHFCPRCGADMRGEQDE